MKVAVNSRLYRAHRGGIPYYTKLLHRKLAELYPADEIVFLQPSSGDVLGKTLTLSPSSPGRVKYLFDLFWVTLLLRTEDRVDIFHGPGNSIPVFKRRGVKYVVTVHDVAFILYPGHNGRLFSYYYRWLVGWSLKHADAVIATSQSTKNDLLRFYKARDSKIRVVHPGVNDAYLNPPSPGRIVEGRYIFSVSTHPRRKNIPAVLRALAKSDWFKNYRYVIAGVMSDAHQNELRELVTGLGLRKQVTLFGYATEEQLFSLYSHAEFFIYPSFYEGFGFPVLEAMVCGCPVITSNTSSLPELLPTKDWLVDPNSEESIASMMERLIKLPLESRQALIDSNRQFARDFTWQRTAGGVHAIFEGLLADAKA